MGLVGRLEGVGEPGPGVEVFEDGHGVLRGRTAEYRSRDATPRLPSSRTVEILARVTTQNGLERGVLGRAEVLRQPVGSPVNFRCPIGAPSALSVRRHRSNIGRSHRKRTTIAFQGPKSRTLLEAARWPIGVALGAIFALKTEPAERVATIRPLRRSSRPGVPPGIRAVPADFDTS